MNMHPTQQTSAITQLKVLGNACNKQYIGEFEQPRFTGKLPATTLLLYRKQAC